MTTAHKSMLLSRPKRTPQISTSPSQWGGYYAGYSPRFVGDALSGLALPDKAIVADPWNGSGTTTAVAQRLSFSARGYDINPAVVVVAKARLLSEDITPSQFSLSGAILKALDEEPPTAADPLTVWFAPSSASAIRSIERATYRLLVNADAGASLGQLATLKTLSPLAARFYVALFRTVRVFLSSFQTTNPTWIKSPASLRSRLRPDAQAIKETFSAEVRAIFKTVEVAATAEMSALPSAHVDRAHCEHLPLRAASVDAVITSPPYCTRIDYAMATKPELAVLGVGGTDFVGLRQQMLGTTLSGDDDVIIAPEWGGECRGLLRKIEAHESKASSTYYLRTHARYFASLFASYREIVRILKRKSKAVIVVQDSHYKEVHNDLQAITIEMMAAHGARLDSRYDHYLARTKAAVNTRSQKYRASSGATESVLVFAKE